MKPPRSFYLDGGTTSPLPAGNRPLAGDQQNRNPAMGDNEPGKWHPWCGTTALAAIVLFGIGVAIGAVIW